MAGELALAQMNDRGCGAIEQSGQLRGQRPQQLLGMTVHPKFLGKAQDLIDMLYRQSRSSAIGILGPLHGPAS
jgi:hypothetical protein